MCSISIHFETILESLSKIEENASIIYKNIAHGDAKVFSQRIRTIVKVFSIEEMRHHEFYNQLLNSLDPHINIEILDETYLIILGEIKQLKETLGYQKLMDSRL